MVVRCVAKNDTKAWYDDNKAQIFADFGSLYSAQMSVDGIDARTGEAYDDMVLVKNEATYTRSGEYVIVFTYETLTDSFVQETEDKVDFDLNGLKRLTRTIIAKDTVAYSSVVGTSTTGTSPVLTLAQISEDQLEASEDGFKRIQEVWLESGTLSETIDNVGSQKAKVIETIGADPATPTGYSLASKQESDFEGFQTNRFTFLKDNVILSESEDEVGSQNSIVQEVFNGTPATPSGYSLANKQESDVDGIPTKRYTFLKDNVILSESKDKVGSQSAIVQEVFNGTPATPSGYSIASEQKSDVDGIPTERFTFLENDVQLSQSEDKVGSQLAISQQWFNPDADKTLAGYSLASKNTSDFEGIKTVEFRFLKDDVMLSESEDEVGSQNAITEQWFKPSASRDTKASYSLARKEESDVGGIPTERYTFLKDNVELSRSEDKVGSQLAITTQVFNPTSDPTEAGYSVARKEASDVDGIPTERFTFLKDNVVLSVSEDKVGSQKAIVNEVFNPTSEAITGIDTSGTALFGYSEANRTESDYEGIKTIRVQFLKPSILSLQQDFVGGATTVQVSAFGMTESQVDADLSEVTVSHILISQSEGDYDGITTSQFTYEVDDFEVESQAEDGMEIIVRTELSATNFTSGVIGTSTYKTLFLAQENIDNGNTIKKRTSRYSEAGVLSISPLEEDGFSLAPSYVYVTTGAPASSMTGLVKPNGTALGTNVTWFEPKVQNVEGFSTYTQQVLSIAPAATVKVHSSNKFFTVTEPGVMSTGGSYNSNAKSGAATRYPKALSQPSTYRKKATVDVYLTSVNLISETEVAFTEKGVDWCSVGFDSFYTNNTESTASVSSNWRSFPQYLNSSGTTDSAYATLSGVYEAYANSYGAGDTSYNTTGIYRVELEKYTRAVNGTQLYLKTIVTF